MLPRSIFRSCWPGCLVFTDATATAAAYEAALARIFGIGSGEARDDRARNGSRPDHPLHSAYVAKNAAAWCWFASNSSKKPDSPGSGFLAAAVECTEPDETRT